MSNRDGKPNNELYELNDLLAGVVPSEESLDDILAEIYGRTSDSAPQPPETPAPTPPEPKRTPEPEPEPDPADAPTPILVIDDTVQLDEPFAPKPVTSGVPKIQRVPKKPKRKPKPEEAAPAPPSDPSAWVEPDPDAPTPEELEAASVDENDPRPDGTTPERRVRHKVERAETAPPEEYRAKKPVPKKPKKAKNGKTSKAAIARAKAFAFADAMFSQAPRRDEDIEMAERYIPGTDEERTEAPERRRIRFRLPRRKRPLPEDLSPAELAQKLLQGMNFMHQRVIFLLLLAIVNIGLSWGADSGLQLPAGLSDAPVLLAGIQFWLLGWAIVYSLDVIQRGLLDIKERFPSFNSIASIGVLLTVLDALSYLLFHRAGPAPYCAPATLVLFGLVLGQYDRKKADLLACRQASFAQEPYRVTKDSRMWNARDTFTKYKGTPEFFSSQIQGDSHTDRVQTLLAPFILGAALLFAILASFGHGHPGQFLWSLSVILMAACPVSQILCYAQPWLWLTKRLERSNACLAGWEGIDCASGDNGVLLTDNDFYPQGSIRFNGIKVYGKISMEKLSGCTASILRASGSGLIDLFDDLVRTQGGFYRGVDNLKCYEGGLSGDIRGEHVLLGSADFMHIMEIALPADLKVRDAVFCAIDGNLRGIFALNYSNSSELRPSVVTLLHAHQVPVMVPRDFNITPAMVRHHMKLPVERMEYPPVERRMELTSEDQIHDTLCGILSRDNAESYVELIVGARRLRSAIRISTAICSIASIIGLLLGYYLTSVSAFSALIPFNLILFLLLWTVPTLLISGNVNRF